MPSTTTPSGRSLHRPSSGYLVTWGYTTGQRDCGRRMQACTPSRRSGHPDDAGEPRGPNRDVDKDLTPKDQDKDKDLTPKDQDKDKDLTPKDKDKDKDLTPKDQDKDKDLK